MDKQMDQLHKEKSLLEVSSVQCFLRIVIASSPILRRMFIEFLPFLLYPYVSGNIKQNPQTCKAKSPNSNPSSRIPRALSTLLRTSCIS